MSQSPPASHFFPAGATGAGLTPANMKHIAHVPVFCKLISDCYSVSCWQQKFRMLWRRETGPEASWPGLSELPTRFGAESDVKGSVRSKKRCFWGHCDHGALPGLVSEAARRGWPGQARPGRERLRDRVGSSPNS